MAKRVFAKDVYLGKVGGGRSHGKIIFGLVAVSVLLVGSVVYFSFSKATIVVTPKTEEIAADFEAEVVSEGSLAPENLTRVPGRLLQVEKSGSEEIKDVSVKEIPGRARGTMTVHNDYSKAQVLVTQTRFLSADGVQFRSQNYVSIPAGGATNVEVVADEEGKAGNVGAGRFSIPGLSSFMQKYVYGTTDAAMAGGVSELQVVTEDDINFARDNLTNKLKQEAVDDLKNDLGRDEQLLEGAFHTEATSFSSSANAGDQVSSFTAKETIRVTAVVFDVETLQDLAISQLRKEVPEGRELLNWKEDAFEISVSEVDFDSGTARISVHVEGYTTLKLSSEIFNKSRLVGLSEGEVQDYFGQFEDVTGVRVYFSPFWQRSVPTLPDHISIEIEKEIE